MYENFQEGAAPPIFAPVYMYIPYLCPCIYRLYLKNWEEGSLSAGYDESFKKSKKKTDFQQIKKEFFFLRVIRLKYFFFFILYYKRGALTLSSSLK